MDVSLQTIALWVLPVVFAITLHEAAHGYVAKSFGDRTAEMQGRITLNPLKHIDPVGTILVPGVMILAAKLGGPQFVFGWAKPVPVNFGNLRNPKRDMLWVAAAGPGANLAMAVLWALLLKVAAPGGVSGSAHLLLMAKVGVSVNLVLMALNLLPVPPLDGGRIAVSLLPVHAANAYARLEPYGLFIIVGLLAFGVLDNLMAPVLRVGEWLLQALLGL
jgi:Zn-dependent protease